MPIGEIAGTVSELLYGHHYTIDIIRKTLYVVCVIRSFKDKGTERLHNRERVAKFQAFDRVAQRRLRMLDAATSLNDLKGVGTSLEALKHDRAGRHAIRINESYRICFIWKDGDAYEVEIVDYH